MYKIIIAEDEPLIRHGLTYTFNWEAHDCIIVGEATNGVEGIELIQSLKPDIVIADVTMPIKDGLKMLQETRDHDYSAIILSGYSEFEYAKKAISLQVCEYLLKPLDPEQLTATLKKIISQIKAKTNNAPIPTVHFKPLDQSKANKHIEKAVNYIKENYHHKIVLQDLMNLTGMGSTFLNKQFKICTGHTFVGYLNRVRIKNAAKMMKETDMKIYSIATSVGFHDYKHFISVFKKYLGCSPSDFIQSLNQRRL